LSIFFFDALACFAVPADMVADAMHFHLATCFDSRPSTSRNWQATYKQQIETLWQLTVHT
jgi:hypothetical protein